MRIVHVSSIERLRDGGSLIVSFQSSDSCEYWVLFPIVLTDDERESYGSPVLVNRTTGIEVALSTDSANAWLRTLKPFVSGHANADLFDKLLQLVS